MDAATPASLNEVRSALRQLQQRATSRTPSTSPLPPSFAGHVDSLLLLLDEGKKSKETDLSITHILSLVLPHLDGPIILSILRRPPFCQRSTRAPSSLRKQTGAASSYKRDLSARVSCQEPVKCDVINARLVKEAQRHPFDTYDDIHVDHRKSDGKLSLELVAARSQEPLEEFGVVVYHYGENLSTKTKRHLKGSNKTFFDGKDPFQEAVGSLLVDVANIAFLQVQPILSPNPPIPPAPHSRASSSLSPAPSSSSEHSLPPPSPPVPSTPLPKTIPSVITTRLRSLEEAELKALKKDPKAAFLVDVLDELIDRKTNAMAGTMSPFTVEDVAVAFRKDTKDRLKDKGWTMTDLEDREKIQSMGNDLWKEVSEGGANVKIAASLVDVDLFGHSHLDLLCTLSCINPTEHLRRVLQFVLGVTTASLHLGGHGSFFSFHKEDYDWGLYNLHVGGEGVKEWFVFAPADSEKIECYFRDRVTHYPSGHDITRQPSSDPSSPSLKPLHPLPALPPPAKPCRDQWKHREVLLSPFDIARELNIQFKRIQQRAGDLLLLHPKAFHGGVNHGNPVNIASNFALPTWPMAFPFGCECGQLPEPVQAWGKGGSRESREKGRRLQKFWDGTRDESREFLVAGR